MKGELILKDFIFEGEYIFQIIGSSYDFSMIINLINGSTLEDRLKDRETFDSCMDNERYYSGLPGEADEELSKQIDYISEHFDNLLDSVEYVKLSFENIDNMEFIKKNPLLLSKKIVLNENLDITDYDKLMKLINEYKDISDKIYVSLAGNEKYTSLFDCYKTMNAIKVQADKIKKLGLSPMETIMYVYDQVRNRVYKLENEDDSYFKSRDLSDVIFGDKIVCAGYANIFNALLNSIGIENKVVYLKDKNNSGHGHARNVIYVKDEKYDIDGVYYFDPTWDSKRENETNEYLYGYKYFAKTRKFMDDDVIFVFEDEDCPLYSVHMYEIIKRIVEEDDFLALLQYIKTIRYMSKLVIHSIIIDYTSIMLSKDKFDTEEFLKQFEEIFSKFNKEIPAETMLKIFNNVRKVEYYQNPEWYPYSQQDMYETCIKSNWQINDEHIDDAYKLLQILFGEEIKENNRDSFDNYGNESGLFKEIEQVRLTKVLRLVCDKKNI